MIKFISVDDDDNDDVDDGDDDANSFCQKNQTGIKPYYSDVIM